MYSREFKKANMRHAQLHAYGASADEIAEAKRDMVTAKLADLITYNLAACPSLHPAQRERLIDLLLGR